MVAISGLASVLQDDEGVEIIQRRMAMLAQGVSMLNMVLLDADAGESFTRQSSSVSGLPEMRDRFASSVAKAARMPETVLFGTAPSGLNTDGESGIQGWHKRVRAYQTHSLRRELEKLYKVLWCSRQGPSGGEEPESWRVEFPPLDEPGEREVAELRKMVAETDAIYLDRAVRSPDQVARSRDGAAGWSMETVALHEEEPL